MLHGFQLLKTRRPDENINLSKIESDFGFSLPPLFKIFLSTFQLGKNNVLKTEKYLHPRLGDYFICSAPLYFPLKDNNKWFLSVSYFESIEQILNDWKSYSKNEKEWTEYGFLRIAGIGQGGGLFVGTRSDTKDAIYQVVWDWEEPYMKVAENIFEFIKGFVHTSDSLILREEYSQSQLYKNWDEDFWRIRE